MSRLAVWASPEVTVARIDAVTVRDQLIETGHDARQGDYDLLADLGVDAVRFPLLWERAQPAGRAEPDLSWARPRLERLRERGVEPIATLVHHGSGPLDTSLIAPDFAPRLAAYAGAAARAFPWIRRWTPVNEPLTTARFSTLYGHWYPNRRDDRAFGEAILNEMEATRDAMAAIRHHVPEAEWVATEDLQSFRALDEESEAYAAHKRERSFLSIELALGRISGVHPMARYLLGPCGVSGSRLAAFERPDPPALVAWNYYPHSERVLASGDRNDSALGRFPLDPRTLLRAQHARLGLDFGLGEVHVDRPEAERSAWLLARYDDLRSLADDGLPARSIGAWAAFGMLDWNSLLRERRGHGEDGVFRRTAAAGVPAPTTVASTIRELVARESRIAPAGERRNAAGGS